MNDPTEEAALSLLDLATEAGLFSQEEKEAILADLEDGGTRFDRLQSDE